MKKICSIIFAVLCLCFATSVKAQDVFTDLNGKKVSLGAEQGKIIVLAVGARWLPLSQQQATLLNKLAKKYAGKNVVFYFVATDSTNPKSKTFASDEEIRSFAVENKMSVGILRDSDGAIITKKYKVNEIPAFVLIGKDGQMIDMPISGLSEDTKTLENLFNQISQKIDRNM